MRKLIKTALLSRVEWRAAGDMMKARSIGSNVSGSAV